MKSPQSRQGFTLIELLVVISIIAVLAGLLLPVTGSVMENARKVSAKNTETQIVAAVNSYQTDYGSYPVPAPAVGGTATDMTYDAAANHNGALFNVLRAFPIPDPTSTLNNRRVTYFEYKPVKNATTPKDGFVASGSGKGNPKGQPVVTFAVGDLADPWGNLYCVRIDANYTNVVINPYSDATATASDDPTNPAAATDAKVIRTGVIAYSYGNDGQIAKAGAVQRDAQGNVAAAQGDDVASWQ